MPLLRSLGRYLGVVVTINMALLTELVGLQRPKMRVRSAYVNELPGT